VFKTDANPLLLRMKMDPAGHGWRFRDGTISSKIAHFELASLLTQVGITNKATNNR
jgi:hypothetical protein